MATYTIEGGAALSGVIRLPPSKSHSIRAILLASMCEGRSQIRNLLHSPDVDAMIKACRMMGASIEDHGSGSVTIEGVGGEPKTPSDVVYAGNSGQVLRFFGAIAALAPGYTVITGDRSIREQRPVRPLLDGLQSLGAFAVSSRENDHPPIVVRGPLSPGNASVEAVDSQPLSGLLIAAAFMEGKSEFTIEKVGELPWLELTLGWLQFIGCEVENHNFEKIVVYGRKSYPGFNYLVPADLSSSLYPIAAALITHSEVTLSHIELDPAQGDRLAIEKLKEMGANIELDEGLRTLTVKRGPALKGGEIDINSFIDAITILPVIASFAEGETRIVNGAIARKKECDRIHAMVTELRKMGADIEELEDGMVIRPSSLRGCEVYHYHDHRVVMSLAVAALAAKGKTVVTGADAVKKSYGDFFAHLRFLGAHTEMQL